MFRKKKCVAMLLAGGQGSRLHVLTKQIAKPAVHFGGKYRIIDFTLSNCINSGIDTVGVLTQYQPLELNDYIDNGEPWDLDRSHGGVHILPPYQQVKGGDWYKGTANAIYQNMNFIDRYQPEYVIILSGDHIYKMDYNKMLEYHIEKDADCTIAVLSVPMEEASRFGIMNTYEDGRIYEFEEKPSIPKSNKASMGVYIFKKEALFRYLTEDEEDENSSKDFGKNVIPAMLYSGEKMFAYPFEGYWKDVGTLQSLWEGNMDLLGDCPKLDLNDQKWKISYRHYPDHPHFIGNDASVRNSVIAEGCEIHGTVINSVLFSGVTVEEGAVIKDSVVMRNTFVSEGATVNYSIVDVGVYVGKDAKVGEDRGNGGELTVLGSNVKVKDFTQISSGEIIDSNLYLKYIEKSHLKGILKVIKSDDVIYSSRQEREAIE
ncbi:glucose-1-phosphate adenylyltransferase [Robertmurraya kyonggiensis]|uniref:Glucose-1-phosphate adenylyltransferase n=1 Tax=Robertmurraya kyonggiensis TaxID=1037680 RepID=A0A4U1DCY4_9BACI|nr:glucose-1-phosphate adenylyltransferase [Robertmurraya kyonggiensis]TKC19306.1 glucose-1-phosphate adenylyltransferase [Robertmurraya kyonggiensis]